MYASINVGQVNCNGPTRIVASNTARQQVIIENLDSTNGVYLGFDNTVSSTTGHFLPKGTSITIPSSCAIWGIPSAATVTVSYLETLQG